MTVDEELGLLEDSLRRLKVEYDMFFGGGSKKPPNDLDWRVRSMLKKYSDGRRMTPMQRFRYNTLANRFAVYNDLWRQKLKIKEEGYRRPQDAILSIAGLRSEEEHEQKLHGRRHHHLKPFSVSCSDPDREQESIRELYRVMSEAKERTGTPATASFESFHQFVRQKTNQLRREHGCAAVEYTVENHNGQVRLIAKAKQSPSN